MRSRWGILAVLFIVRAIMAIQYQSVAGMAPLLSRDLGIDLTDIGVLIGLYMAPGVALALPGGAVGRRLGDKTAVLFGLTFMTAGGLAIALAGTWEAQIGGRLVAGIGGVLISVLLTNMVADWFGPKEIATATALLMVSWPVGLALSLMIVPAIAAAHDVATANGAVAGLAAIGFVLLATCYRPHSSPSRVIARPRLQRDAVFLVIIAAAAWSLYTLGYGMIVGFGPSMLAERGLPITDAGSTTSVVIWLGAFSPLIGGALADKTKRYSLISVTSYLVFAVLLLVAPRTDSLNSCIRRTWDREWIADCLRHEPACTPVARGSSPDRARRVLHRFLRRYDGRAGVGREIRLMARHGRGRLRLWRRDGPGRGGDALRGRLLSSNPFTDHPGSPLNSGSRRG